MSDRKKPPSIPTAPIADVPEELHVDHFFDGCPKSGPYSSRPFTKLNGFKNYAKDLRKAIRYNGKGDDLFPDEGQFLAELDNALLHYEIYRPIVTPEICGTFKEQRKYFRDLEKALKRKKPSTRLTIVQEVLAQGSDYDFELCCIRRLMRAKLDIDTLKRLRADSCDSKQPLDPKTTADLDALKDAVNNVMSDLKGKQSGQYAELYLLIEQLGEMYQTCSGRKPSVTETEYADKGRGAFFNLVTSILHTVFNKEVTTGTYKPRQDGTIKPYTIIEGIRFLKT